MKIESIIIGKNSAAVTAGGKEYRGISLEVLYREGIEEGGEISEERWYAVVYESEKACAKEYIFNYLSNYVKSRKEAEIKLYGKGFHKPSVDYAVGKAEEYGLIDDAKYAKMYASSKLKTHGALKIRYELKMKGIEQRHIDAALPVEETADAEYKAALLAAEKYIRTKNGEPAKDKMFAFLAGKGFDFDLIKRVIKETIQV